MKFRQLDLYCDWFEGKSGEPQKLQITIYSKLSCIKIFYLDHKYAINIIKYGS